MAYKDSKLYAPYGGGKTYYYTLGISATESALTDDDKATNHSTIDVIGTLKADGDIAFSGGNTHTLSLYWYDDYKNPNGALIQELPVSALSLDATATVKTTISVEHKADGTLKGYAKVTFTKSGTNAYVPDSGSVTLAEFALSTIPRATKLNSQTLTINTKSTIKWTKSSGSFKHTLTYEFGSLTGTIGTAKTLVDSADWTPPNSFYQQMKNSKVKKGKLYLTTYNGNTQIGDTQEAELTINAKESEANVVIEEFSIRDENSTTKALTGDNSILVLGKSTAFVTLIFTARKWATVSSVTINGKTFSVTAGTTDSTGNTSYSVTESLGTATTKTFNVSMSDSRTFPANDTTTNDIVENYVSLSVVPTFKRIAPTTGKVGLQFDGNYFNGSFGDASNSLTISYKYKKSSETSYTSVSLTKDTHYKISGNKYYSGTGSAKSVITLAPTFDYKTQYDMQLLVSDKLTSLTINAQVVKGIPIMWWNGEKVQVNGDLYLADDNGENVTPLNVSGNVSKNLFNSSTVVSTSNITVLDNKNGVVELRGVSGYWNQLKVPIYLTPNTTYTIKSEYTKADSGAPLIDILDANDNQIRKNYNATDTVLEGNFTTNSELNYIVFRCNGATNTGYAKYSNIQIEKGTTATEYEEYYAPTISIRNSNGIFQEVLNGDDTGWIDVILESGFGPYTDTYENVYRRKNGIVELQGAVTPTAAIPNGGDEKGMFYLPEGFRPWQIRRFICQGSGSNRWLLTVHTDGKVSVARYGTTSFVQIPAGAWLPFSVTFMVD